MLRVFASRLGQMLFVLWLLVTAVFFLIHLAPGDATMHLAMDPNIPPEARQMQQERLGLDQPLPIQYWLYVSSLVQGDLGVSFSLYPREVGSIILERMPRTVALLLFSGLLAYGVGFLIGKRLAWWRDTGVEHVSTVIAVFLYTVFPPWAALVMIWIFAFELGWFPSGRFLSPALWRGSPYAANQVFLTVFASLTVLLVAGLLLRLLTRRIDDHRLRVAVGVGGLSLVVGAFAIYWLASPMRELAANIAWHTTLPTVTLMLLGFGASMLLTRTSMLETMQEDYVLTARAKGLPERVVRNKHVARTALLPVVASLMLTMVSVITGSIVFEAIFSWPGLGLTFLSGAIEGDVPLVTGTLVAYGVLFMIAHFVLDLVYTYLDPRIRV